MSTRAECYAALVLLMDKSSSIKKDEYKKQLEDTAAALDSNYFRSVVKYKGNVLAYPISFHDYPKNISKPALLRNDGDIDLMIQSLMTEAKESTRGGTDLTEALEKAIEYLNSDKRSEVCASPSRGLIIDVSHDGEPNKRTKVKEQRNEAIKSGITINSIAVQEENAAENLNSFATTPDGFTVNTVGWDSYFDAFILKLAEELGYKEEDYPENEPLPPMPASATIQKASYNTR